MTLTRKTLIGWVALCVVILVIYSLLPVDGTLLLLSKDSISTNLPHIQLKLANPAPGEWVTATVVDEHYQVFTTFTVDGEAAQSVSVPEQNAQVYTWEWMFTAPETVGYEIVYYANCHSGCEERRRITVGQPEQVNTGDLLPTKLGVVMANPARDWYGRSGWAVELTYTTQSEQDYWGVDDLSARIHQHLAQGLKVIIRVDYDPQQSIPAEGDQAALTEYLAYLRRLARDERLSGVYGYVIGSDMNVDDLASGQSSVPPAWYARVFLGYGLSPQAVDNAVQTIQQENSLARVIVGPVRPWMMDVDGDMAYTVDAPWLNYMHTLVAYLDEVVQSKADAGTSVTFDGFDVQAPANLAAVKLPDTLDMEPILHLPHPEWPDAQAGFRVYEDWLAVINAYPATDGMPVYIISTNTYQRDAGTSPAENYPVGWLTNAYQVINAEPQITALCWFLDVFPNTDQWDTFSLTIAPGKLRDAADEFDALLAGVE